MSKKKVKLSVVLATFNEEKNIGKCLKAVKDLADEVVLVDGSSMDKTAEIAKNFGARIFITKNQPIFHINKQMAVDKARGDWILQLDADEIVSQQLKKEIYRIIKKKNNGKTAYFIPRKNYFLGKWLRKGGQYPDYVIRLFKKGKAFFPCKSVHEQIQVEGEVGYLKGHLLHYTAPKFSRYLVNANRYTNLTADKLKEENLPINLQTSFKYLIWLPIKTFFSIFVRHKGFVDGLPGFVFALFSGLHHTLAYIKYLKKKR